MATVDKRRIPPLTSFCCSRFSGKVAFPVAPDVKQIENFLHLQEGGKFVQLTWLRTAWIFQACLVLSTELGMISHKEPKIWRH